MNKKISGLLKPSMRLYLVVLIVFAAATLFLREYVFAAVEALVIILLLVYTQVASRTRAEKLLGYIESVTSNVGSATKNTQNVSPMPYMIFSTKNCAIQWANEYFQDITGGKRRYLDTRVSEYVPGFKMDWLLEGKNECPELYTIGDRKYRVYGSVFNPDAEYGGDYLATTYWIDITEYSDAHEQYLLSRPIMAIILLDNYDELFKNLSEMDKTAILAVVDDRIGQWTAGRDGILTKYNRDRYFFLFEERYYLSLLEDKFSLLDEIHECVGAGGIKATLSIGIGKDGKSPEENYHFAKLALEMALSRGGDQAVVKDRFNFDFFGGHSAEVEKWTKVKSRVMSNALGELISDASKVFVMGHKNADLDTIGAAVGINRIALSRGKKTKIIIDPLHNMAEEFIEKLRSHEEYAESFITGADAIIEADSRSLLVVVDTNRPEEVESEPLLLSCNSIAVIDHHRRASTYIDNATLNFHEPYASSASELVTEMLQYLVAQPSILKIESEALLAGIVLDTKSFAIHTGSRTFDAAAYLRRAGADTADVKKLLQSDFSSAVKRYSIVKSAVIYKEGIAIAISEIPEGRVVIAQAADELLNIAGIECSFVLAPIDDGTFISGRSIGNMNVQIILEKLGGGGNQATAGAQLKSDAPCDAERRLKAAIDEFISEIQAERN